MIVKRSDRDSDLPPAIVLGGDVNALSIARSLARSGVTVYAVNESTSPTRYSRYVRWIPMPGGPTPDDWGGFLLGSAASGLRGAVLLAASDAALEFVADHRLELATRFRLDISDPSAQLCMLDKLCTYRAAAAAGVPTPRFWAVASARDVAALGGELVYPLIVKPRRSHVFEARFGRKFFVSESFQETVDAVTVALEAGTAVLLMELIPGPDDQLSSYYTYLDDGGQPLFEFTKRVIRRHPVNMGPATYHVTDAIPALRDPALALFRHVGLRGVANVEFKLDPRDGILRLIECNARFTASNELLVRAGFDLAPWVYRRILGDHPQMPESYRPGLHLWSPAQDFQAFLGLHATGQLGWLAWIRGLLHRQAYPVWDWRDPVPSVVAHGRLSRKALGILRHRLQNLG
jgi:D-aspartate ligase